VTRRLLVTGGAGFIGSHVCEALLAGGAAVEILDDFSTGREQNVPAGTVVHRMDVRSREAAGLVATQGYDGIVHLAAQMDVRRSVADPLYDSDVNIRGAINLLEAMRTTGARARFVFSSTGGVLYGDHHTPPNFETTRKEPDSPYAIAKLSVEHYMSYYARIHGLDTVALRFANVYGPRQDPHGEAGVVAIFCGRLLEDRALTVFGDGTQTRDYVYVSDVVDAVRRALDAPLAAPTGIDARAFNIGTGVPTSVLALADALRRVAASDAPIEFAPHRPGEQQASFVNVDKARAELGWAPRMSLEQGLSETFAWFAARAKATAGSRA
jgi:UDP-glucose 4-epimerase